MERFVLLCLLSFTALVGCRQRPSGIPGPVYEKYESLRGVFERGHDEWGLPFVVVGRLKGVEVTPHKNLHGNEWGVTVEVKQVVLGRWRKPTMEFGVGAPDRVPLKPGVNYFIVASWERHGIIVHTVTPVTEEPNQLPDPTLASVTSPAGQEPRPR